MSRKRQSVKVTLLLPERLHKEVKHAAVEQGTSMSWLVVEGLCLLLGISPEQLEKWHGPRPPKKFADRKGDWTTRKGTRKRTAKEEAAGEADLKSVEYKVVCQGCGKVTQYNSFDEIMQLNNFPYDGKVPSCPNCGGDKT